MGALEELCSENNWELFGDVTPEEAAAAYREIIDAALPGTLNECPSNSMPTPFWDEDQDVDDELPDDAQPWYGYVTNPTAPPEELDFVENAAIWTITGFLAIATWEIGAAPAILFNTIAPKFALAVKRGDFGEIIRIFLDGAEAARVDTSGYAPGDVIRVKLIGDPENETHEIIIVQEA